MSAAQNADDVLADWRFSLAIFGEYLSGNACERDAVVAETGDTFQGGFWDQTRADLATAMRDVGNGWEPVPDWYALHHLPFEWREAAFAAALIDGSVGDG